jgi:hypothetical protein
MEDCDLGYVDKAIYSTSSSLRERLPFFCYPTKERRRKKEKKGWRKKKIRIFSTS